MTYIGLIGFVIGFIIGRVDWKRVYKLYKHNAQLHANEWTNENVKDIFKHSKE